VTDTIPAETLTTSDHSNLHPPDVGRMGSEGPFHIRAVRNILWDVDHLPRDCSFLHQVHQPSVLF